MVRKSQSLIQTNPSAPAVEKTVSPFRSPCQPPNRSNSLLTPRYTRDLSAAMVVSTRRQTHASPNPTPLPTASLHDVEDLAIRSKRHESPQASAAGEDVRTLRDGKVHGAGASPGAGATERPSKRRRTATPRKDKDVTVPAATPTTKTADLDPKKGEGDVNGVDGTVEVNGGAIPAAPATVAAFVPSKHRRFESEEPADAAVVEETNKAGEDPEDLEQDDDNDDDDDAPEEVTTTSSKLVRGLPLAPQPKKKTKKRKREDARDEDSTAALVSMLAKEGNEAANGPPNGKLSLKTSQALDTNESNQPDPPISSSSISSEPSYTTAPEPLTPHPLLPSASVRHSSSSPSSPPLWKTPSAQHAQAPSTTTTSKLSKAKPLKPKPQKDIHIPSKNLTIKYDSSFSSSSASSLSHPTKQNKNGRGQGSLPMKVNSQSRNMREQLLRRGKGREKVGRGSGGDGKGFLVGQVR